uniref:Uncharacterized protein n=1 Tax=Arundo donax TaxID=35708 RepID=A0A0A8ZM10_ARUDO
MTMVGGAVPSLMRHQLSAVRRRSRSSRCSCRRIGAPLIVTSRMSGRTAPRAPAHPAAAILEPRRRTGRPQRRIPSNTWRAAGRLHPNAETRRAWNP